MTISDVQEYYANNSEKEWKRLQRHPVTQIEFETTKRYIDKYLKKTETILDIGGGPGRYTFWLAERGNKVILADYTKELIDKAKRIYQRSPKIIKANILGISQEDVRNLSKYTDSEFDATICLGGVLSHLVSEEDRISAINELSRVTEKDGFIFISVISLLATIKNEIIMKFIDEVAEDNIFRITETGDYDGTSGFTSCHFFTADDLKQLIHNSGLELIELVGLEGFASHLEKQMKEFKKNDKAWNNIHKIIKYYEKHPSVIDFSEHILAVCKNTK